MPDSDTSVAAKSVTVAPLSTSASDGTSCPVPSSTCRLKRWPRLSAATAYCAEPIAHIARQANFSRNGSNRPSPFVSTQKRSSGSNHRPLPVSSVRNTPTARSPSNTWPRMHPRVATSSSPAGPSSRILTRIADRECTGWCPSRIQRPHRRTSHWPRRLSLPPWQQTSDRDPDQ